LDILLAVLAAVLQALLVISNQDIAGQKFPA
jgi:hypothetical protein